MNKKLLIALAIIALSVGSAYVGFSLVDKESEVKYYVYQPGEFFVTNITDSRNLLKSNITIEMRDKKKFDEFQKNTFKIRDIIIYVLRSKTYDEIKNPNIQNILKTQIKNNINELFGGDGIEDIFFNEFVLQ